MSKVHATHTPSHVAAGVRGGAQAVGRPAAKAASVPTRGEAEAAMKHLIPKCCCEPHPHVKPHPHPAKPPQHPKPPRREPKPPQHPTHPGTPSHRPGGVICTFPPDGLVRTFPPDFPPLRPFPPGCLPPAGGLSPQPPQVEPLPWYAGDPVGTPEPLPWREGDSVGTPEPMASSPSDTGQGLDLDPTNWLASGPQPRPESGPEAQDRADVVRRLFGMVEAWLKAAFALMG